MLDFVQRVYVQHPSRRDNLIPAAVLELREGRATIRFLQPAVIPSRKRTRLFFHDQHHVFNSIECEILRMECGGPQPIGTLGLIGQPQRDEKRQTFRVGAHGDETPVHLEAAGDGHVLNISCTGIAVAVDSDGLEIDTRVDTTVTYNGQPITGRMRVRNWAKLADGRFRYGLEADPGDGQLLSELARITQDLQLIKARRASRLGVNARLAHTPDPSSTSACPGASARDSKPHGEPAGQTKRQHDRKPWSGGAKIYLLEAQNLRILDVTTIDLSPGGLSFSCANYVYEGSELLFEKPVPGGLFRIRGVVRSSFVNAAGKHRIGIQFIGGPLQPHETAPELAAGLGGS